MTSHRLREYEILLRKLRQDPRLFEGDRVANLIDEIKAHCAADWRHRVDCHKAQASERFAFRTS